MCRDWTGGPLSEEVKGQSKPLESELAGESTAALMNTHVRDNTLACAVAVSTAAGDVVYASGANALVRLAAPTTARSVMRYSTGSTGLQYGPVTPASSQFLGHPLANYRAEGGTQAGTSGSIDFTSAYAAAPIVVTGINANDVKATIKISAITTTGFTWTSADATAGNAMYWLALGSDT